MLIKAVYCVAKGQLWALNKHVMIGNISGTSNSI